MGLFASQGKKSVCQNKPLSSLSFPSHRSLVTSQSQTHCLAKLLLVHNSMGTWRPSCEAAGLSPESLTGVAGLHSESWRESAYPVTSQEEISDSSEICQHSFLSYFFLLLHSLQWDKEANEKILKYKRKLEMFPWQKYRFAHGSASLFILLGFTPGSPSPGCNSGRMIDVTSNPKINYKLPVPSCHHLASGLRSCPVLTV